MPRRPASPQNATPPPPRQLSVHQAEFLAESCIAQLVAAAKAGSNAAHHALFNLGVQLKSVTR